MATACSRLSAIRTWAPLGALLLCTGATTNPDVTPETIQHTICRPGDSDSAK